jgi:Escherichia/Staphylococcus phage prohead protease
VAEVTPQQMTFTATNSLKGNTLDGTAHAFGQRAQVAGHYIEFAPGAFDAALARSDARAFMNHNTDLLLGRESSGTLRLSANAEGLHYSIDLPATSYAEDLKVVVGRKDLTETSFGIYPGKYTVSKAADGLPLWTYSSVEELFDVSPVSLPAFSGTSAQLHAQGETESTASQAVKARHRVRKETT